MAFFKQSSRGSNPEPRASEEDAVSTPLRPTWLSRQLDKGLISASSLVLLQIQVFLNVQSSCKSGVYLTALHDIIPTASAYVVGWDT